jgi:hypothetical protein
MFGDNYHEFDNNQDLRDASPELIKSKKDELTDLHDHIGEFVNTPSESPKSQKWIEKELENEKTPIPRKGSEKLPHPKTNSSQQAKELGLQYFGSGRYGKDGKVTHHSIQDNLKEIEKEKPQANSKPKKISENTEIKLGKIEKENKKRSFLELRKAMKSESIDCGIESGLSMASSGENLARPSAEVIKKDGKAGKKTKEWSQKIQELTGDTTTASIGDEKEDELKKKGINLLTFKSRNFI